MTAPTFDDLIRLRSELGRLRYGRTLAEAGLSRAELAAHWVEEMADATAYAIAYGPMTRGQCDAAIAAAYAHTEAEIDRLRARPYSPALALADVLAGADPGQVARRLGYPDAASAAEGLRRGAAR